MSLLCSLSSLQVNYRKSSGTWNLHARTFKLRICRSESDRVNWISRVTKAFQKSSEISMETCSRFLFLFVCFWNCVATSERKNFKSPLGLNNLKKIMFVIIFELTVDSQFWSWRDWSFMHHYSHYHFKIYKYNYTFIF